MVAILVQRFHKSQLTSHGWYYSACNNSCIIALEELSKVGKSNPDGVIVMSSGTLYLSLDWDYRFMSESLRFTLKVWSLNNDGIYRAWYKAKNL